MSNFSFVKPNQKDLKHKFTGLYIHEFWHMIDLTSGAAEDR